MKLAEGALGGRKMNKNPQEKRRYLSIGQVPDLSHQRNLAENVREGGPWRDEITAKRGSARYW